MYEPANCSFRPYVCARARCCPFASDRRWRFVPAAGRSSSTLSAVRVAGGRQRALHKSGIVGGTLKYDKHAGLELVPDLLGHMTCCVTFKYGVTGLCSYKKAQQNFSEGGGEIECVQLSEKCCMNKASSHSALTSLYIYAAL